MEKREKKNSKSKTVPPHIISATAIDCDTGEEQSLRTIEGSGCHFFERFLVGEFEVRLRLDWTDPDDNGDPMLDADFYHPGETRDIKEMKRLSAHQTNKTIDPVSGVLLYDFGYASKKLRLVIRLRNEHTATAGACIKLPDDK